MTDFLKIAKSIVVHFAHICAYGVETVNIQTCIPKRPLLCTNVDQFSSRIFFSLFIKDKRSIIRFLFKQMLLIKHLKVMCSVFPINKTTLTFE